MSIHWMLEYDDDGEVYTSLEPSSENLESCLHWFDGETRFYCAIGRTDTDDFLQCFGEPDKRIIEGTRDGAPFVVRKAGPVGGTPVPIRTGAGPTQSWLVDPLELLTSMEALEVMEHFRQTEELLAGYVAEPKSYLHRRHSDSHSA